ncbi:hypothetical protein [Corynebacterium guangdongense]|uniref:Uncharacterized protein n=1 Tax=Corynebacterium guangdongense TaxID=1783348 RepID=A0ABU1ZUF5_9CORY|nr:hypothetical protein [Corynebacterium guangdongense]MDR7328562.1 hypothetical protein [Corynebacterium guangdongense]WJZ17139.1 hypothetical protein CGUA_02715 [Corynebacterium guangdongense]
MTGSFHFDADEAEAGLTNVMGRAASEREARAAQRPAYAAGAAGRDFTDVGQRIADALARVHREGDAHLTRVHDVAEQARRQVRATVEGDAGFAAVLDRVLR